jgi:prevent-host-death family protein
MKTVSTQELKKNLSALLDEAASGVRVLITRHKTPIAYLESADLEHLQVGARYGKARLSPLLKSATAGRYLDVLADDRRGRADED